MLRCDLLPSSASDSLDFNQTLKDFSYTKTERHFSLYFLILITLCYSRANLRSPYIIKDFRKDLRHGELRHRKRLSACKGSRQSVTVAHTHKDPRRKRKKADDCAFPPENRLFYRLQAERRHETASSAV